MHVILLLGLIIGQVLELDQNSVVKPSQHAKYLSKTLRSRAIFRVH